MKNSPRICHITVGHNPLDDRIFYKEVCSLVKKYKDINIVAPERQKIKEKNGVKFSLFKESNFFSNLIHAFKAAKNIKADLYHIHEFEFLPFALVLKYKYQKKVIYDAHETIFFFFTEFSRHSKCITFLPAIFAQSLEWFCSHFVDHIITVTPWVAKGFKPFHKRISLIYNYPILNFFSPLSKKTNKKREQIILYHGQLVPARNIDVMLKAMSLVKKDFPNVKLLIVGEVADSYKIQLEQIVKQNYLENVVEFRKPIPYINVPELIKEATIGLSSMAPNESFKRSIQIKPFEFMTMGIPVLGCRVPSTEIFIEQTGSGILIDPPTAENLGKTINYLLQNPEVMEQMSKNGRKAVSEKYNWSFMENKLYDIYEEVLMC